MMFYHNCVVTVLTDISIRVSSLFTLVPLAPSTGVSCLTLCTGVRTVGVITGHVVKVGTGRGVAVLTNLYKVHVDKDTCSQFLLIL